MENRRTFLRQVSLTGIFIHPAVAQLAKAIGLDRQQMQDTLQSHEFHHYGDDLSSLHFYFFNTQVRSRKLQRRNASQPAYMLVRISQQHVSEEMFADSVDLENKLADTFVSGFSYLAFELWPGSKAGSKDALPFNMDALMSWHHPHLYRLLTPQVKPFQHQQFEQFRNGTDGLVTGRQAGETNLAHYQRMCAALFEAGGLMPVTLLEIPGGLFMHPHVRQGSDPNVSYRISFSPRKIRSQVFVYNAGRITRYVKELWHKKMLQEKVTTVFDQAGKGTARKKVVIEEQPPELRIAGYQVLPELNSGRWLPDLISRKELVFLTSLGRRGAVPDITDPAWGVHARQLYFTGLGAFSRFQFRNYMVPQGTSLVEYEHYITLGRDEYVKVSRIGVIAATGQRALYTEIGKRKVKNGVSYMDFKKYVEIIQPEILFDNPALFKAGDAPEGEPDNYANANFTSLSNQTVQHVFSYTDHLIHGIKRVRDQDPEERPVVCKFDGTRQDTHVRRLPFRKITAVTLKTQPINTEQFHGIDGPGTGYVFWAQKEKVAAEDEMLHFIGEDWNGNQIKFSAAVLFIDKRIIDTANEQRLLAHHDNIYRQFFKYDITATPHANAEAVRNKKRRTIQLNGQEVAFSRDYKPAAGSGGGTAKEEMSNRSNVSETEFYEYYFSLCKSNDNAEAFNRAVFPLYPQLRKAKIFIENIRSMSPAPLPSMISYNQDFIDYAYQRPRNGTGAYNKAKLVFDHTRDFINGIERDIEQGYARIKEVFGNAGDKNGALINPDIDIESIGVVKQSIAVARHLNTKYEGAMDAAGNFLDKIEKFNPIDLLRGKSANIFGGVSLLDVLEDVMSEFETPVFDIKALTANIEAVANNPLLVEIRAKIDAARELLRRIDGEVQALKRQVEEKIAEIRAAKEALESRLQVNTVRAILENQVRQSTAFVMLEDAAERIRIVQDKAVALVTNELLSAIDTIGRYNRLLAELQRQAPSLPAEVRTIITDARNHLNTNAVNLLAGYADFNTVKNNVRALIAAKVNEYEQMYTRSATLEACKKRVVAAIAGTPEYRQAVAAYQTALRAYQQQEAAFYSKFNAYKAQVEKIRAKINDGMVAGIHDAASRLAEVYELLLRLDLPYYLDLYDTTRKDIASYISKIKAVRNAGGEIFNVEDVTGVNGAKLQQFKTAVSGLFPAQFGRVEALYNQHRAQLESKLIPALSEQAAKFRATVNGALDTYVDGIRQIGAGIRDIRALEEQLRNGLEKALRDKMREYENEAKKLLKEETGGLVGAVKEWLKEKEAQLRDAVDEDDIATLTDTIAAGHQLIRLLQSVTRKDIDYTWQTTSVKSADFGIVTFEKQLNPATALLVSTKNTLHFDPGKFPPVLKKVDMNVQSSLTNFSMSFFRAIEVSFKEVSFTAGNHQPAKFNVQIAGVSFAGALSFVQAFEDWLKSIFGDNFRLKLNPTNVNIGYTLPIPDIKAGAFNFFNLTLNFDFFLHFTKQPMELKFSLATLEEKFGITAGIYAGFGYFSLTANPKHGITDMEIALEFGGYFGLSLGPIRGDVKLAVGLYYNKKQDYVVIEGYFICEGRAKIWCVMISVRFYMGVRSQGNYVEGRCTVTYSIRLGRFFKKSFTASYYKKLAGAQPANRQQSAMAAREAYAAYMQQGGRGEASARSLATFQAEVYDHEYERKVQLMTAAQWNQFINSYID